MCNCILFYNSLHFFSVIFTGKAASAKGCSSAEPWTRHTMYPNLTAELESYSFFFPLGRALWIVNNHSNFQPISLCGLSDRSWNSWFSVMQKTKVGFSLISRGSFRGVSEVSRNHSGFVPWRWVCPFSATRFHKAYAACWIAVSFLFYLTLIYKCKIICVQLHAIIVVSVK